MKIKKLNSLESVKAKKEGGKVIVKGWANYRKVDDIGDLMEPDCWDTSRFDQNPLILFNHDWSYPIGKCFKLEQKSEGLWYEAELSESEHEKITYVRDLVSEGILKTSSVGYEELESKEEMVDGKKIKRITKAKLHEISIVSLPMNDASTISAGTKSKAKLHMKSWKTYRDAKKDVLNFKGAWVASAIHEAIYDHQEDGKDREEILAAVAARADVSREMLAEILAGDVTPVPENILEAFSLELGMSFPVLRELNNGDAELPQPEPTPEPTEPENPEAEPKPEGDEKVEAENEFQKCVAEKIPALIAEGKEQDQAVAIAMQMCKEGKCCDVIPTQKMIEKFAAIALQQKVEAPGSGTNMDSDTQDNVNTGNPHLELMQQQIVLLGAIANKLDVLNNSIMELTQVVTVKEAEDEPEEIQPTEASQKPEDNQEKALDPEVVANLKKNIDTLERAIKMMAM